MTAAASARHAGAPADVREGALEATGPHDTPPAARGRDAGYHPALPTNRALRALSLPLALLVACRAERPAPASPGPPLLDAAAAARLFPIIKKEPTLYRYDPVALLVRAPFGEESWPLPEHPAGRVVLRANNLGFGRDQPTRLAKSGLRILVAGDSHTHGMVNNAESFPNVLERLLAASHPEARYEVLNAGVGFTGPSCHLGMLRKQLPLAPDAFVAVLFTGNDFSDEVLLDDAVHERAGPAGTGPYMDRLQAATSLKAALVYQGANQAYHFKHFPARARLGLELALRAYQEMKRLCREHDIAFLAAVLPTKPDVDADDRATFAKTLAALEMTEAEYAINARLGDELGEALHRGGIPCLDLAGALRAAPGVHYWKLDYHLDVAGHAVAAAALRAALEPLLAERAARAASPADEDRRPR